MSREHGEEEIARLKILVMEMNTEAEEEWKEKTNEDVLKSSAGSLCGLNHKLLINLFKWAGVSVKRENQVLINIVNNNKQHQAEVEEISRLKISLMEKNTEVDKLKSLCLKQREEIKSLKRAVDSTNISSQLQDLLDHEFASFQGILQSLADDVAQMKAEKYYGRVNHDHTHFTSPPMKRLYDRGEKNIFNVVKPQLLDDQDYYYTSCHYANSHHHPDEEYGGTTATGMYPPP